MFTIEYPELKAAVDKIFNPIFFSLLQKKEVELKNGVLLRIDGELSFTVTTVEDNIYVKFRIKPKLTITKLLGITGNLTGALIKKNGIMLEIDGLPDVFIEV